MRHQQARRAFGALALVAMLGLAACSSSASRTLEQSGGGGVAVPPQGIVDTGSTSAGAPVPAASPASGTVNADLTVSDGPQIVRTGSLDLEITNFDSTILKARASIIGLGGYQSDSQRSTQGDQLTAMITYRIPAARWDDALDALRGLAGRVLAEDTKAVEVTGQVLDLGARISNLQTTELALQKIMAQATKISDILDVQNQLTQVQGQIEELSTQKAHLQDQAAMGTLAVTFTTPVVAVTQATSGWNLAAEIDRAVAQLVQLGQGVAVAGLWLGIVGLPILILTVILLALVYRIVRRTGLLRPYRPEGTTTGGAGA